MLEVILYILLAIVVLLILALLLPIRFIVKGEGGTDGGFSGTGRVMLFAGLLGGGGEYRGDQLRIGLYLGSNRIYTTDISRMKQLTARKRKEKKAEKEKEKEKKKSLPEKKGEVKKPGLRGKLRSNLRTIRKYSFLAKMAFGEIKSLFHFDRFIVQITLGLDDPSQTGRIMGILYAINGVLPEQYAIHPGCDFTRRVISGNADVRITFRTYLFWVHLVKNFWSYKRFRREEEAAYEENLKMQEA